MWVSADFIGVIIISALLSSMLLVSELMCRSSGSDLARKKIVQVLSGALCLCLPFLIQSELIVFGLAIFISGLFHFASKYNFLRSLQGVSCHSRGAIYYPLAIFLIFLLSRHVPWLYVASTLVLVLSDLASSLVASRYGRVFYSIENEPKSLEGSIMFFLLTFLAIQIPMLLMTSYANLDVILASLLVAMTVTAIEAVSLEGLDNLYIPISVCFVLQHIVAMPSYDIFYQNISLIMWFVVMGLAAWRLPAFNAGAAILLSLFFFGLWLLGTQMWVLPFAMMGVGYFSLWYFYKEGVHYKYSKVRRTAKALTVPFIILVTANYTNQFSFWFMPFVMAITTLFMTIAYNFVRHDPRIVKMPDYCRALVVSVLSWLLIAVPTSLLSDAMSLGATLGMLQVLILLCLYNSAIPALSEDTLDRFNSKNAIYPMIGVFIMLILQYFRVI